MKDIIIIGAGGVGREVAFLIEQINEKEPTWNILGFLDDNPVIHNTYINGYRVIGEIDGINTIPDVYVTCALTGFEVKRKIVENLIKTNKKFANLIHPSVTISSTNSLGEGVIIYPGVVMTTNISIGNYVVLSPNCGIGHESVIEDYTSVLWNVNISGNVSVGMGCLLGTGSTIIQNIKVGRETTIGAGAVVVNDLPERCTVVGVPAKIIKIF
ncbi:MAG: acetyltransferase [Clostridiaceae bacterium]|nr:acetyltransferase [Clostridiaceae bacterium]